MLREINQMEKIKNHDFAHMGSKTESNEQTRQKCIDTVDSLMVTRGNGGPGDRKKKRVKHGDGRRFSFGQ